MTLGAGGIKIPTFWVFLGKFTGFRQDKVVGRGSRGRGRGGRGRGRGAGRRRGGG